MKKGIVVVSFGTTSLTAIEQNISRIEKDIENEFSDEYVVVRAFTSNVIIKRLYENNNIKVFNLDESLIWLKEQGITDVIIQPLHIIPGKEYDKICNVSKNHEDEFSSVAIGDTLLTGEIIDFSNLAMALESELPKDKHVVLVGHGTAHEFHHCYNTMENKFIEYGRCNITMGTLEESPNVHDIIKILKEKHIKEIFLMPFLLVCGAHVERDINGTWKTLINNEGINCEVVLKSLGEYQEVRKLYINKIKKAIS